MDTEELASVARSERLLLETYNVHLQAAKTSTDPPGEIDTTSVEILKYECETV